MTPLERAKEAVPCTCVDPPRPNPSGYERHDRDCAQQFAGNVAALIAQAEAEAVELAALVVEDHRASHFKDEAVARDLAKRIRNLKVSP